MQGRLSPRPADRLQAFPRSGWQREFSLARKLGFDAIEWIFEADAAEENPIRSQRGRAEIRAAAEASGVAVRSVCAGYFMVHRLAGGDAESRARHVEVLLQLIREASDIGAQRILLPLLETSAVDTPALKDDIVESLRAAAPVAAQYGVILGLEMELPGVEYARLIERVGHAAVRAYYDVGNSSAQGVDVALDIVPLLPHLFAVHVKDRKTHGGSVPLGQGDTNFPGFFRALSAFGFRGDLLLQHYFADDPEGTARAALGYVREQLSRAREAAA